MKTITLALIFWLALIPLANADYERNKAVPVEKVLFGQVLSVRNITEQELIQDKNQGWKTFGGALIGGAIGNQFGSGSGRGVATILGAIIGGSISHDRNPKYQEKTLLLVELMIKVNNGDEYMVIQDLDHRMLFQSKDPVRMIYLANGTVRIDKQM
ncbi:glycine zipper 2TM domain-containing protein [Colwellia sp. MB02u-10]|uniref:glycine zipper 2TM domain-containing protein n=1 Tax=Colwellia sp. MB02u-10 TaxID=2759828 RepID=UPI0015F7271C|nr:glycine zipper 2TM domain-containing protein [Colwellia sp. MB02u-10]MBA6340282.1 glycine zipper 2TM domain-containing protein [Colwellia sp. MB02u-10]